MKKIMMGAAACALTSLFAGPALAAGTDGFYVSGNIGVAMPRDATLTSPAAPGFSADVDFDSGLALGLALGYKFGPARVEGELAYQKNDFDDITVSAGGVSISGAALTGVPFSGDVKTTSFLLNGYYDFANDSAFTPYLTAGLGFAKVKASSDPWDLTGLGGGVIPGWSDSDTVFAYQIGAGLEYALSQTVSLDARYRYFATSDPSITIDGENFDAEFASHNLLLGVRVSF